eukprot:scaffold2214_cov139-Cylindrotheca_fusiformis.AAC.6
MSLQIFSALNKPPLVTAAGAALAVGVPMIPVGTLSLGALQAANVVAYCINVAAVSVPGRIDGSQDDKMRHGNMNPDSTTPLVEGSSGSSDDALSNRERTILRPAGWAFAIWGVIYLGEAVFCGAQFIDGTGLPAALPSTTAPFVAANLFQSLWCAAFRPSYNEGWRKYVSVAMLGATAVSLSAIPSSLSVYYFTPMVMHFGWATAATLVNLNGSIAMSSSVSESTIVGVGLASSVAATILGMAVTLNQLSTPVYGLTVAWALAAVANGVSKYEYNSETIKNGASMQKRVCGAGSALCLAAAAYSFFA